MGASLDERAVNTLAREAAKSVIHGYAAGLIAVSPAVISLQMQRSQLPAETYWSESALVAWLLVGGTGAAIVLYLTFIGVGGVRAASRLKRLSVVVAPNTLNTSLCRLFRRIWLWSCLFGLMQVAMSSIFDAKSLVLLESSLTNLLN